MLSESKGQVYLDLSALVSCKAYPAECVHGGSDATAVATSQKYRWWSESRTCEATLQFHCPYQPRDLNLILLAML
jgi:hypothetical protein